MTATNLVVIDSSGWMEFLTNDTKADLFARYFGDETLILLPTIIVYEVRKVLLIRHSKTMADEFVSRANRLRIIPIDIDIALDAAALSSQTKLPMADALIYTCAQRNQAQLITSDSHFSSLSNVTTL
jgi:toxin FitB